MTRTPLVFQVREAFLAGMLTCGPPGLWLALLLGALGLPLPGTMSLLAAGALAGQGCWIGCRQQFRARWVG